MTSDTICGNTERSDEQEMKTKKVVKECNEFLEEYASNDAILNGMLLWINIQRHVTPENIWKTQAVTKFLKEEITDAKEILWRIIGESELGKMKKRQGTTKTISEINDICYALNVLSEKDRLPIFLSTSDMVSQTPIYISHPVEGDSSEINARLRVIEESLNSIIASSSSKNESTESTPASSTAVVNANITNEGDQNQTECLSDVAAVRKTWADITVQKYKKLPVTKPSNDITEDNGWTTVQKKSNNNKVIRTWRQRLDILRGTAISETEGESLSADIHLVAYGVAKNVTGIQLSQWLAGKGLRVLSCDLLTKYEGARSLSYKITVKSCDYDKAHNPEIWPARVGVRLFKFFNAPREMKGIDRYNNRSPQTTSSRIGTNNRILTDTRPRVLQSNRHVKQQNTSRYEVQHRM